MTNFNEAGEGTEGAPKPEPHRRLLELTDDSLGPRSIGPKIFNFCGGYYWRDRSTNFGVGHGRVSQRLNRSRYRNRHPTKWKGTVPRTKAIGQITYLD
jgi:hypothetical protein